MRSAHHSRHSSRRRDVLAPAGLGTVSIRAREVSEFLSQKEVAAELKVTPRTIRRWIAAGMPCSVRRRKVCRINLAAARAWLADGPGVSAPVVKRRIGRPRNLDRGMAA